MAVMGMMLAYLLFLAATLQRFDQPIIRIIVLAIGVCAGIVLVGIFLVCVYEYLARLEVEMIGVKPYKEDSRIKSRGSRSKIVNTYDNV